MSRLSRNRDYHTILKRAIILEEGQTVDDIFNSTLWRECKKIYFNDSIENSRKAAENFYNEHKVEMHFNVL
ncbi:hypothetical protein ACSW9K_08240 [Clostridium perfringens]